MAYTTLHIGFDDTDSAKGMCTTFLAYKMVDALGKKGAEFLDFPRLVRLNPNIPWKTRGNGAVSLKVRTGNPAGIKKIAMEMLARYSDIGNGANPGLAFLEGEGVPDGLAKFSEHALWQLIPRQKARRLAAKNSMEHLCLGNGQGLVGALGAIGYQFEDHTLELLTYRRESEFGKERRISADSVRHMHENVPGTFGSFDAEKRRVLISPHGPDPVFYGIRGEGVGPLLRAAKLVRSREKPDGHMIFKSNQGTGDHLRHDLDSRLLPHYSGRLAGTVCRAPERTMGGHVFFWLRAGRTEFRCAVYKPTGMTRAAMALIPGDTVCVGGGVRKASRNHPRVLNAEFIKVVRLEKSMVRANPVCARCSKSMKSKGAGQGYACVRCGSRAAKKTIFEVPRSIRPGLYTPALSAHRHLSRPQSRVGRNNKRSKFDRSVPWISTYDV